LYSCFTNHYFTETSSTKTFVPTPLKFPKHVPRDADETFKNLADTYYQRTLQGRKEISAPYKQATYPIEQREDNQYFERQLSSRYAEWKVGLLNVK
jgi:hypothetical protein